MDYANKNAEQLFLLAESEGLNRSGHRRTVADCSLAEEEGFEPSVDLHLRLISSQVHSTTLPPLRSV
jgi:hypothetical protein